MCEDGLFCFFSFCIRNKEQLEATTGKTCDGASNTDNKIKVMSYNVFLLHDWGLIGYYNSLLARGGEKRRVAVNDISNWLKETKTDVDVILVQEQFDLTEEFKAGMIEAGYCNSVTDERGERFKSGLAIFSKHPIVDYDFWNWCDRSSWTPMCGGGAEALADKGILYAKININGNIVHVTNTHTTSDSLGNAHSIRMLQFEYHVEMMSKKNPNNDALALMAGDFNENYYDHHQYDKDTDSYKDTSASAYYTEMLPALNAKEISLVGDGLYTYDSVTNTVLHEVYEDLEHDGEYRERLDYIFPVDGTISDANLASSTCQILNTVTYSDHYPVECTITIA
jgi:exonuclease III